MVPERADEDSRWTSMEEAGWNSCKTTQEARLRNHITVPFPSGKVCTIPLAVCVGLLLTILRTSRGVGIKKQSGDSSSET